MSGMVVAEKSTGCPGITRCTCRWRPWIELEACRACSCSYIRSTRDLYTGRIVMGMEVLMLFSVIL